MDAPFLGQIEKFPFAAALGAAMIMADLLFPAGIFAGGIPDDLRIGTHEKIISPAFQLFSAGGIQHFIIFPLICDPHIFIPHFVSNIVTGIICKVSGQNCICACMHRIIIRDNHTGSALKKQSFYCRSVAMKKIGGQAYCQSPESGALAMDASGLVQHDSLCT